VSIPLCICGHAKHHALCGWESCPCAIYRAQEFKDEPPVQTGIERELEESELIEAARKLDRKVLVTIENATPQELERSLAYFDRRWKQMIKLYNLPCEEQIQHCKRRDAGAAFYSDVESPAWKNSGRVQ
jgi:hypothetical protein